jgi:hypothetical protein
MRIAWLQAQHQHLREKIDWYRSQPGSRWAERQPAGPVTPPRAG